MALAQHEDPPSADTKTANVGATEHTVVAEDADLPTAVRSLEHTLDADVHVQRDALRLVLLIPFDPSDDDELAVAGDREERSARVTLTRESGGGDRADRERGQSDHGDS